MKAVSAILGFVLVVLITVSATAIVLTIGQPAIRRAQESGIINEAFSNMRMVDNLIREVASEGIGSLRTSQIHVSDGEYRVDRNASTFTFLMQLDSDTFSKGSYRKEGNLLVSAVAGAAKTTNTNATHIVLENEILSVVLNRTGTPAIFDGLNTTNILRTITIKPDSVAINVNNSATQIGNFTNTSWGIGYSAVVRDGDNLPRAEAIVHLRSNLTGIEYELLYTLPASADFFYVKFLNVSRNQTTFSLAYSMGTTGNDTIRMANNESTYNFGTNDPVPRCYTTQNISELYACSYDNFDFSQSRTAGIMYSGSRLDFVKLCNERYNNNQSLFNMTAVGAMRVIVPFTNGACTTLGNETSVIDKQEFPAKPFADFSLPGKTNLEISLQYDNIKLIGDSRISSGTHRVCLQKSKLEGGNAIVNVTRC